MQESNFQLLGKPRLNSISFEVNRIFHFEGALTIDINNDVEVRRGEAEHSLEAFVVLKMGIFTGREFDTVPFRANLEMEGYFKWDEELDKNNVLLDSLLKQNAAAVLYSYLRPIITLITVEASVPPLVIPLMNFKN